MVDELLLDEIEVKNSEIHSDSQQLSQQQLELSQPSPQQPNHLQQSISTSSNEGEILESEKKGRFKVKTVIIYLLF